MLSNKKILLGITGSIAAYKSVFLVRMLVKAGAEVRVVMTPAASDFVSQLTFSTLSKNKVYSAIHDSGEWENHVELGLWADLFVVAPATAKTIAAFAQGNCANMLQAAYLSARCPVIVVPAMDEDMWKHPSTQRNIRQLKEDGVEVMPVGTGELASGLVGEGRLPEPEEIFNQIRFHFQAKDLEGIKAVITAGPTFEAIDPVRFIGNWSSGKMGLEIAKALSNRGAIVQLVIGPTSLEIPNLAGLTVIPVESAAEMFAVCQAHWDTSNVAVMSAAVADFTPKKKSDTKIKKKDKSLILSLKRTEDIALTLGKNKNEKQILVGFALETEDAEQNAISKLKKKKMDFIVLNSLNDKGAGFRVNTNKITIIHKDQEKKSFPLMPKSEVAELIVEEIANIAKQKKIIK